MTIPRSPFPRTKTKLLSLGRLRALAERHSLPTSWVGASPARAIAVPEIAPTAVLRAHPWRLEYA